MEEEIPKKKTNGKRNKQAGHQLERDIAILLREIGFPFAATSRAHSKGRDNAKVDIMNQDEDTNGRLPYNLQAKNTTITVAYPKLLSQMPKGKEFNVIIHNQTAADANGKFQTRGQYALMDASTFYAMLAVINKLRGNDQDT